jgi:anti-sigma regulatory factor (Ser/Thr protein kinase)
MHRSEYDKSFECLHGALCFVVFVTVLKPNAISAIPGPSRPEYCNTERFAYAACRPHSSAASSWADLGWLWTPRGSHPESDDSNAISIKFNGKGGNCKRRDAESIGLIVTELVINSLKHAFDETTRDGEIKVSYDVSGTDWQLAVSDNGSGKPDGVFAQPKTGLGTGVVKALSKQLDAQVVTVSGALGTKVPVTHATFAAA